MSSRLGLGVATPGGAAAGVGAWSGCTTEGGGTATAGGGSEGGKGPRGSSTMPPPPELIGWAGAFWPEALVPGAGALAVTSAT